VEIAVFIYSTLSTPPLRLCTYTNFQGRKILCLIFFPMLDIVSPYGFLSSMACASLVHTHIFFLYSFLSCKLKNYYDFGAYKGERGLGSCLICLLNSSPRKEIIILMTKIRTDVHMSLLLCVNSILLMTLLGK
jgi:hypothetical protein